MLFATGYSNGGTFTWAVGAALADRLAAIVPLAGSPHPGFSPVPAAAISVLVRTVGLVWQAEGPCARPPYYVERLAAVRPFVCLGYPWDL